MKVGVFIPCAIWHEQYLESLLRNVSSGAPAPDSVAVVISGGTPSDETIRMANSLCKISCYDELVSCGDSKNMAYEMLPECDVITYTDADDRVTADRIEVVRREFSSGMVLAMNHSYVYSEHERRYPGRIRMSGGQVLSKVFNGGSLDSGLRRPAFGDFCGFRVHAGAVCVRRDILNIVPWKKSLVKDEDKEFCTKLLYVLGSRHIITNDQIYIYNNPEHRAIYEML